MKKILAYVLIASMCLYAGGVKDMKTYEVKKEIYLAGGCFWGVEGYFAKLKGVLSTDVGYANGKSDKTNYHALKDTDHAETLHLVYDASRLDLAEILLHFFRIIDPTSLNKQGNDVGRQYRSGIYYIDDADKKVVDSFLLIQSKNYKKPLVVEVSKLKNFVLAEEYHQDYLAKNPNGYCHIDLNLADKPLQKMEFIKPNDDKLKSVLSELSYAVTQQKATERPFSSKYDKFDKKGIYVDIVSRQALFSSSDKFDAGCGWPSFSKPITQNAVSFKQDNSHGLSRTEVLSSLANSHLGHVFDDGVKEKGGLRYCINGASLEFVPLKQMEEQGYGEFIPFVR